MYPQFKKQISLVIAVLLTWVVAMGLVVAPLVARALPGVLAQSLIVLLLLFSAALAIVAHVSVMNRIYLGREKEIRQSALQWVKSQAMEQTLADTKLQSEMRSQLAAAKEQLRQLEQEARQTKQRATRIVMSQYKLKELRSACAHIDELTGLLQHRNEYDSFEPPKDVDTGDFTITYFRMRIVDALESFKNNTTELLQELEGLVDRKTIEPN